MTCQHPNCTSGTWPGRSFCHKHSGVCTACGASITPAHDLCRKCYGLRRRERNATRPTAHNTANDVWRGVRGPRAERLAMIELYHQALARGFRPDLCQRRITQLQSEL